MDVDVVPLASSLVVSLFLSDTPRPPSLPPLSPALIFQPISVDMYRSDFFSPIVYNRPPNASNIPCRLTSLPI